MQQLFKRMLSVLLAVAVLLSLTVTAFAADDGADAALTAADYAAADALFNALEDVEQTAARRDASADGRTQAICDYLNAQDAVVPGSVETSGERINWMTEQGIACAYSPRLEQIAAAAEPTADDTPDVQTRSYAARGTQHGRDVYLFQPYYGVDRSFTEQYQKEAQRVAQASEGTYHYYKGDAATIDAVADAITDGGVVFFDSHGSTDYENGEDYTSGATTSYLCLQTGDGLTKADYDGGHAVYSSTSGSMKYFLVDGTVIADHMDADAQANNGLLWMAICLGMATDGLEKPLMDRGLGAVYGYSQSVTFVGDYTFEAVFFDSLLGGSTVAEAITDMKTACGAWDCSPQICQANGMSANYQMTTLEEAQRGRAAFPIVVSADDTYPGHGNVDALQDVNSGWALLDRETVRSQRLRTDGGHRHAGARLRDAAGHDRHGQCQHRLLCLRLHRHARGRGDRAAERQYLPHFRTAAGLQGDDPLCCQDAGGRALLRAGRRDAAGCRRLYRRSDHTPAADGHAHG